MRTALDASTDKLDPEEKKFVEKIREYEWHCTGVCTENELPGFSYTTGFYLNLAFPEVIVFSLRNELAHSVLWDVCRDLKAGRKYVVGARISGLFANRDAYLFPVAKSHYKEHLGWSRWFYGGDNFPCLQLLWPDRKDRFPWEEGFSDEFVGLQPDLTPDGWTKCLDG